MPAIGPEFNFCRRCGSKLQHHGAHFTCGNGHIIYANAVPAVAMLLLNSANQVLVGRRALDPHEGMADFPGGFCGQTETLEDAIAREIAEETGLTPQQYDKPQFLLSGIDHYPYRGETVIVISSVFMARTLNDDVAVTANDDIAQLHFTDLVDLDVNTLAFPSLQQAYLAVKELVYGK